MELERTPEVTQSKLASVSLAARLSNNTFINLISSESAFPTSQVRLLFTVLPKRLEKKKKKTSSSDWWWL